MWGYARRHSASPSDTGHDGAWAIIDTIAAKWCQRLVAAREAGSGLNALAFDGAVDRLAAGAANGSATSRVMYSPLHTRDTGCASWRRLTLGCSPTVGPWPWRV